MNQKVLIVWALAATGAALYFAGLTAGRQSAAPQQVVRMDAPPSSTDGSTPARAAAPVYTVPTALNDLARYWRSPVVGEQRDGFATLVDVHGRKVIIEQCHHHGWFDERTNRPVDTAQPFCKTIVNAKLATWSGDIATAVDRDGKAINIAVTLSPEGDQLRLELPGQKMMLVTGTTNDMLQAMEQAPGMAVRRGKYAMGSMEDRPVTAEREGA
ncbi:MAG: hypothetical protein AB8G16_03680 [Gammaproteobacteria bacterium]